MPRLIVTVVRHYADYLRVQLDLSPFYRRLRDSLKDLLVRPSHERVLTLNALLQPEELQTLPRDRTPNIRAPHARHLQQHLAFPSCHIFGQIEEQTTRFLDEKVVQTAVRVDGGVVLVAVAESVCDQAVVPEEGGVFVGLGSV